MKKSQLVLVSVVILYLLLTPFVFAQEVIVFENYHTTFSIKSGKLFVEKELRMKNVGDNPIIPGEIHFKISQEGTKDSPDISDYVVENADGDELDTQLIQNDREASLVFTVWDPLLPGFFYDVKMSYEIDFKPKGVLFYSVLLPEERTTIPINDAQTTVILPKRDHITFAPDAQIETTSQGRVASWDDGNEIQLEYSIIPLPRMGFKAVNLFWIIIMAIFAIQLFLKVRKLRRL